MAASIIICLAMSLNGSNPSWPSECGQSTLFIRYCPSQHAKVWQFTGDQSNVTVWDLEKVSKHMNVSVTTKRDARAQDWKQVGTGNAKYPFNKTLHNITGVQFSGQENQSIYMYISDLCTWRTPSTTIDNSTSNTSGIFPSSKSTPEFFFIVGASMMGASVLLVLAVVGSICYIVKKNKRINKKEESRMLKSSMGDTYEVIKDNEVETHGSSDIYSSAKENHATATTIPNRYTISTGRGSKSSKKSKSSSKSNTLDLCRKESDSLYSVADAEDDREEGLNFDDSQEDYEVISETARKPPPNNKIATPFLLATNAGALPLPQLRSVTARHEPTDVKPPATEPPSPGSNTTSCKPRESSPYQALDRSGRARSIDLNIISNYDDVIDVRSTKSNRHQQCKTADVVHGNEPAFTFTPKCFSENVYSLQKRAESETTDNEEHIYEAYDKVNANPKASDANIEPAAPVSTVVPDANTLPSSPARDNVYFLCESDDSDSSNESVSHGNADDNSTTELGMLVEPENASDLTQISDNLLEEKGHNDILCPSLQDSDKQNPKDEDVQKAASVSGETPKEDANANSSEDMNTMLSQSISIEVPIPLISQSTEATPESSQPTEYTDNIDNPSTSQVGLENVISDTSETPLRTTYSNRNGAPRISFLADSVTNGAPETPKEIFDTLNNNIHTSSSVADQSQT
uniref:Uncharacterized protein n=1 Tax=Biomphalaria glabrata TaxID=6526 RepID=A0A2C9KT56_BIOGL